MIDLKDIGKDVSNDGFSLQILRNITLTIEQGEFVAIIGPSGSGKSTLMHIIGFLDAATVGTYRFKGKDVAEIDERERSRLRLVEIGFVFQAFHLLPSATVQQNVRLPLMYAEHAGSEREQRQAVASVLESVGLSHRANHSANRLSGGEKQRVAIARALINQPTLLLADEPTGNLDSKSGAQIVDILKDLNRQGKTVVLVTHDQAVAGNARRVISIMDGTIDSDRAAQGFSARSL